MIVHVINPVDTVFRMIIWDTSRSTFDFTKIDFFECSIYSIVCLILLYSSVVFFTLISVPTLFIHDLPVSHNI